MKRIIILLISVISSLPFYSQFKVTGGGLVCEDGKSFYVVEFKDINATDLYKSVMKFVLQKFKNPDIVSNKIEDEMINIHGYFDNAFMVKKTFGVKDYVNMDMNLIIQIKDDKIRFDIPIINEMVSGTNSHGNKRYVVFVGGDNFMGEGDISLFKKGKVKDMDAVKGLEKYINTLIADIVSSVGKSDEW